MKMLVVSLLFLAAVARADSTAISYADLSWAAATFSGPVAPVSQPNWYSTLAEAGASNLSTNAFIGGTNLQAGWISAVYTAQLDAENYATASADTELTAFTTNNTVNYQLYAQTERSGSIVSADGSVQISIPYSLSMVFSNDTSGACCYTGVDQLWIDLWDISGHNFVAGVGINRIDAFGNISNYSEQGTISLDYSGDPGSYWFDVGAASQTFFVPDSTGTLPLALIAAVALIVGKKLAAAERS